MGNQAHRALLTEVVTDVRHIFGRQAYDSAVASRISAEARVVRLRKQNDDMDKAFEKQKEMAFMKVADRMEEAKAGMLKRRRETVASDDEVERAVAEIEERVKRENEERK